MTAVTQPDWVRDEEQNGNKAATDTRHADILRSSVIAGSQLDSLPAPEPLINGILFRGTLAALYGPSGVGKSFVAMAMAMSVASGSPWQGHDCLLYTSPSPRDRQKSRMPSSA